MSQHIVTSFDAELIELDTLVLSMGRQVLGNLHDLSLLRAGRNDLVAQRLIEGDRVVDDKQIAIEEKAVQIIAKRQPVAVDLRTIIATLKIATDLERVGDLVKNNAKRTIAVRNQAHMPTLASSMSTLEERVEKQLADALAALEKRDAAAAKDVWAKDVEVDTLQASLFRELLTYMMEDPRNIGVCTHLLFCARNLERIGDHATNISEQVHFIVTGKTIPGDRPRGGNFTDRGPAE